MASKSLSQLDCIFEGAQSLPLLTLCSQPLGEAEIKPAIPCPVAQIGKLMAITSSMKVPRCLVTC